MKASDTDRNLHGDWQAPPRVRNHLADRLVSCASPLFSGEGLCAGAACGYLLTQPENVLRVSAAFADRSPSSRLPIVLGVDMGGWEDLAVLARASAFLSSNPSPDAWCAVQARRAGIPSVIGIRGGFQDAKPEAKAVALHLEGDEGRREVKIVPRKIAIEGEDGHAIVLREGDLVTVDGTSGRIYKGREPLHPSPVKTLLHRLVDVMKESIERFGPVRGWTRYRETVAYRQQRELLAALACHGDFKAFQRDMVEARLDSPLKVLATARTVDCALLARLSSADIVLDGDGDLVISPVDAVTGIGMLQTERLVDGADGLDALRMLVLQEESSPAARQHARALVAAQQTARLGAILKANSGCPTVVRTLCLPWERLYPEDLDLDALWRRFRTEPEKAGRIPRAPGMPQGGVEAGLEPPPSDLIQLEIEVVLQAGVQTLAAGGEVDLTILVSMATHPDEIGAYMQRFDEVYDSLQARRLPLPVVKLAALIEAGVPCHRIERFLEQRGRHIEFAGVLFGSSDPCAPALSLNRHDAMRTIVPRYVESGSRRGGPFTRRHERTAGMSICRGLERLRTAAAGRALAIGFGGDQAGDARTISWLTEHAAPLGLTYITTSPDRMTETLLAAADA